MVFWQSEGSEAFGDGGLEPGGQLWRGLAIIIDQMTELGLGAAEVLGVPDLAQLAAPTGCLGVFELPLSGRDG